MKKKVQLVLGSGGARGVAHIGVIEMLLQDGFEIAEVYGCSMGAVIGGIYCAGFLPQYKDWLLKLNKSHVRALFDLTFSRQGFVKGEKIFSVLEQLTGKQLIENMPVPFVAVATDILNRKEVHFREGNLYKALRASTGMPGIFTPVRENSTLFVDGGVLNPLPVNLVSRRADAIIVAVNLNGPFENKLPEIQPLVSDDLATTENESVTIPAKMRNFFYSMNKGETKTPVQDTPTSLSALDILRASYDATLDRLAELSLKTHPPDLLIEVPRNTCTTFDFHRSSELIEAGKKLYSKAMKI